jgi:hypothetical protein
MNSEPIPAAYAMGLMFGWGCQEGKRHGKNKIGKKVRRAKATKKSNRKNIRNLKPN